MDDPRFRDMEVGALFGLFHGDKHQTYVKSSELSAINLRTHKEERIHYNKRCEPPKGLEESVTLAEYKGERVLCKLLAGGKVLVFFPLVLGGLYETP